jgi:superfamily II DNA or RNA helicase
MENPDMLPDEIANVGAMGRLSDLLAKLDTDPYRRGKQFEHVCKWFLTHDAVYAHEFRHVWLWQQWDDRWSDAEAGIDLVAEDRAGKLWAIQAKCYGQDEWITKRELNKFLSESARPRFSDRLLIATTDRIDPIARRTMSAQDKPVHCALRKRLEDARVDWPGSPSDLRGRRLPPNPPWPHQEEAVAAVINGFERADRGQLIMACGTGKTLTALYIHEKLGAQKTLVLVPSLSLLDQTVREWVSNATSGFDEFLAVCSDDTVAQDDEAVLYTSDLGFDVKTDPAAIAAFLRRPGINIVFATYQSSPKIASAFQLEEVPDFDLVIADEAHRCVGPITPASPAAFRTVLDGNAIRARRRLFMTATPRYFTGRLIKQAREEDFEVASMDNPVLFGKELHRFGFREAIERQRLTDYQVVVVGVDDATYRDWARKGRFVTRDGVEVENARTLAGQIGLSIAMRRYGLRRVISFHTLVDRARDFVNSLQDVMDWMPADQRPDGQLWCDHVSGEMSAGERHRFLQRLATLQHADRGLLANVRCLGEGVDVPTLDGVAFIDPRQAEIDIVQAVGRAIRLAPDKTIGTIVIPIFVDTDEGPEIALGDSVFEPVWNVIKALRAHDDWLGEQLDALRRQLGQRGGIPRLPDKIRLDLPTKIGDDFARAFDVRLVQQTTVSWEFWFGLLQQFVERHGHARVQANYVLGRDRLGAWVANQRSLHSKGTLGADRERRLEEVSGWTWDPIADYWVDQWAEQWEEGFKQLLHYVERQDDARVPSDHTTDNGYRLGWWTVWQRDLHGKGTLDADRERRLQELPGWTWDPRADNWEEGFRRLLEYVESNGDARILMTCKVDGFNLGSWVKVQRRTFANGSLEADRIRRLEELPGWSWDPFADQWEEGFRRLVEYAQGKGDARVPRSCVVDGYNLGAWVKKQRSIYDKGSLDADRQRRLEELPGWSWDPFAEQWEEGFQRLTQYVERHGDALVPGQHKEDGYNLGGWVKVQRGNYAKGTLGAERKRRLQVLPGWKWETLSNKWEDGFTELLGYVERQGDALVPRSLVTEDGYRLGAWINTQRNAHATGTLSTSRDRRLEELPGWTWNTLTDQWEDGFQRLADYVKRNGDARVPSSYASGDGYRLGQWINIQRNAHAKGTLDADRERRLQELPGWVWNARADRWEEGFSRLLQYVKDTGSPRVPQSHKVDGLDLGTWVVAQRYKYNKGSLAANRGRRLEEVPGWSWNPFADQWEEGFRQLVEYVQRNGDARVPRSCVVEGFRLGAWVQKQRAVFDRGGGDPERRRRLQKLPGWSWTASSQ